MSWQKPFPKPIMLKGNRKLVTLSEAGQFISNLPETHQIHPRWSLANELVLHAVKTGHQEDVTEAMLQVFRAAKADDLIAH
jgi:hypothetical protein